MKKQKNEISIANIFACDKNINRKLPLYLSNVKAGFPSPAEDYIDKKLDLNEFIIKHPSSTFFVKVKGDSMMNAGIISGSILVVDRAIEAVNNKIIVAVLDGEFTVKRLKKSKNKLFLMAENKDFAPIEITPERAFEVWGVVTHVIQSF